MLRTLISLGRDDDGSALVEYALGIALFSLAAYASLTLYGTILQAFFTTVATNFAAIAQAAQ